MVELQRPYRQSRPVHGQDCRDELTEKERSEKAIAHSNSKVTFKNHVRIPVRDSSTQMVPGEAHPLRLRPASQQGRRIAPATSPLRGSTGGQTTLGEEALVPSYQSRVVKCDPSSALITRVCPRSRNVLSDAVGAVVVTVAYCTKTIFRGSTKQHGTAHNLLTKIKF